MAYNKKEYKIIKELKNEVISSKINSEEIKKIYLKEFRRIFGDVVFDELIDFSGYSQYWSYLFTSIDESKKTLVVHSDLTYLKKDKDYRKTFEVIPKFDEIVALSDEVIEKNKKTNSIFIKKTN